MCASNLSGEPATQELATKKLIVAIAMLVIILFDTELPIISVTLSSYAFAVYLSIPKTLIKRYFFNKTLSIDALSISVELKNYQKVTLCINYSQR